MTNTTRNHKGGYTTTITAAKTPTGKPGYRITCTCSSHGHANSAIVADNGTEWRHSVVHGTVLMAHHPARPIRVTAERRGIWAA